ncbi:hypothetical protein FNV43_RR20210 [Rhamnella rubrinervis]|uniref:Dirigent protein n=1 Tax=Rhamnella rubrinervis TaxID=2594499 RepID=A0A8K0GQ91_9ROSA|nr:hypothetical protein FNV43_RR20210 [Rhamnella rubrinervis]
MAFFQPYTIFFIIFSTFFIKSIDGDDTGHLHFYFHDILSGKNPTAVSVLTPTKGSAISFGTIRMIDDALTEEQDSSSKVIGRAQGFYSAASQSELAFLMVITFSFVEGEYSGSTLSILGRNPVQKDVREMPVVGGTGKFRFARGYALAHTVWLDASTGDATVEYNVHLKQDAVSSQPLANSTSSFSFSLLLLILSAQRVQMIHPSRNPKQDNLKHKATACCSEMLNANDLCSYSYA